MDTTRIRDTLAHIERIVKADDFESWKHAFVEKYVSQFDYGEENKLIYTDIHREYEEGIEKKITEVFIIHVVV